MLFLALTRRYKGAPPRIFLSSPLPSLVTVNCPTKHWGGGWGGAEGRDKRGCGCYLTCVRSVVSRAALFTGLVGLSLS